MRLVAPGAYGLFPAVRCESRAALAMLLAFPLQRRVIHVPQKSTMTEDALHWSCYTTPPARSLEIFEEARARCPVARSSEHEGFYMLLQHADVKRAMGDHQTFSSEPQVLRPMLPRNAIPALEMDPPRHGTWRALFSGAMTAKTPREMEPEETLRLRPPFFGFFRRTTAPVVIANREIAQGCDVYMSWAAANRDPQAFEEPAEFKLRRPQNRHLTFGYGIHSCPGSALARMELRVLLEELLRRTPDLTVQTDAPVYHFGGGDYSYLSTLPVAFGAGTREGPR
jgi:cytochrome P450